jgi:hypothetical protein
MQGPVEAADRQPTPTMDCSCEENGRQSSGWVRESLLALTCMAVVYCIWLHMLHACSCIGVNLLCLVDFFPRGSKSKIMFTFPEHVVPPTGHFNGITCCTILSICAHAQVILRDMHQPV